MSAKIIEKLKPIIETYLDDVDLETVTPESHLINDLGLDSFFVIDMVIDIENEFDISIDNDAIATIETVQDVINLINKNIQD